MFKAGSCRVIFILLSLLATSCAHYYAAESDLSNRVKRWNEKKEFGRSISTLELVRTTNAKYQELQALLEKTKVLASAYEKQLLIEADELVTENHWQHALNLYNKGIKNLPNNYPFQQARDAFYTKRQQYTDTLEFKLLIADAKSLPERAPLIIEIAKTNPDNSAAQQNAIAITHQVEEITKALLRQGKKEIEESNNTLAVKYFTLAIQLSPNNETEFALDKINRRLDSIAAKERKSEEKQRKYHALQMLSQYQVLFDNKQYAQAKEQLATLRAYREQIPQIDQLEIKLEQTIMKKIQSSIELGQRYYSQGHFEEAYQTWRKSLNLSPNDSALLAHIERVQRVLESLRRLNNSEQTLEFPQEETLMK